MCASSRLAKSATTGLSAIGRLVGNAQQDRLMLGRLSHCAAGRARLFVHCYDMMSSATFRVEKADNPAALTSSVAFTASSARFMLTRIASRVSLRTLRIALASAPRRAPAHRPLHARTFDMSCATMPAAASAKPTALARRAGARVAPRPSSVRASLPRHTRAYAASGESFSPGEMHPLGAFEVVSADADVPSADMIVVSMCEADAEKLAADDAVFESLAPGLAAVVKEMATTRNSRVPGSSAFARVAGFPFKHVGVVARRAPDVVPETWIGPPEASAAARKAKRATVAVRKYWMEDEPEDFAAKAESIALGVPRRARGQAVQIRAGEGHARTRDGGGARRRGTSRRPSPPRRRPPRAWRSTRQLVAAPPNAVTPTGLACGGGHRGGVPRDDVARVLEKSECEAAGMGSFLGVAEASDEPPKFIHLTYTRSGADGAKKVAVVGKGLTFDSGGYNIKAGPGSMIEMMKFDMGGAGATSAPRASSPRRRPRVSRRTSSSRRART